MLEVDAWSYMMKASTQEEQDNNGNHPTPQGERLICEVNRVIDEDLTICGDCCCRI